MDATTANTFIGTTRQMWAGYSFEMPEVILAFVFLVSPIFALFKFQCAE